MTNFLVKHFVHNYQDTEDLEVRTAYGILAGVVGIFCNLFLFPSPNAEPCAGANLHLAHRIHKKSR